MKTANPNSQPNTTRLKIFSFCTQATARKPLSVDSDVANKIGIKTALGLTEPSSARYIKIVIGISVTAEVLMTINKICASEAVSFFGFSC